MTNKEIEKIAMENAYVDDSGSDYALQGFVEGFKYAMNLKSKPKTKGIEERKEVFMQKVATFMDNYPKEMLREFYDYWTEHGDNDRKFRKEKEKSFDTGKRLARWYKNYKPSTNAISKQQKTVDRIQQNLQGWS